MEANKAKWAEEVEKRLVERADDCDEDVKQLMCEAACVLAHLRQPSTAPAAIPEGFVLVPTNATRDMIAAAEQVEDLYKRGTPDTWRRVFRAMVEARPYCPEVELGITAGDLGIATPSASTALPAASELVCPKCEGSGEMTVLDTTRGPDGGEHTVNCDLCGGSGGIAAAPTAQPGELPPMPEPADELCQADGFNVIGTQNVFTADQMTAYGQACAAPLRKALQDIIGCFDAADIEGLQDALEGVNNERLTDLFTRRLLHAKTYAEQALAASGAQAAIGSGGKQAVALGFELDDLITDIVRFGFKEPFKNRLERIRKELATAATPTGGLDGYYLASFKREGNGFVTWWGPNDAGYTPYLDQAGIYRKDELIADYHDSRHTVPVPVEFVRQFEQRVVDAGMSVCEKIFWTAENLRAAIAAATKGAQS